MDTANHWELAANKKAVAEIAPCFVKYVKELFFNDIGFGTGMSVCDVKSSYRPQSFFEDAEPRGDRFRVLIPYGGRFIKWEVIFDWYHPDRAPDFLFSDDFLLKPDRLRLQDKDFLAHWENWNHTDPKSLLYVLRELQALFQEYQVSLLEAETQTSKEFERLVSAGGISPSAIEVLTGPGDSIRKARPNDKKTITFLINLAVDFSSLEGDIDEEQRRRAMIFAEFYNSADTRPRIEMRFSPEAEDVLRKAAAGSPPAFTGPLQAVVGKAALWLTNTTARLGTGRRQRCELLGALVRRLHPGLVEMDSKNFLHSTFLVDQQDFNFLLSLRLSDQPGPQKPDVRLLSVYHLDPTGQPISKLLEDFPYAANWKPEEKVNRILRYCFEQVREFKEECIAISASMQN